MSIMDWKAGDRAYISGEPTAGLLSKGDVVRVGAVDGCGKPWANRNGDSIDLIARERQPLRILQPGDVIPKGAATRRIRPDGTLADPDRYARDHVVNHAWANVVIVSIPDPAPDDARRSELLAHIEALKQEVAALEAEGNA